MDPRVKPAGDASGELNQSGRKMLLRAGGRYPRLSMKRGAFTLASNSRAMVPAGWTLIFGVTWKV